MYEQIGKPKENKSREVANSVTQKKSDENQGFGIVDNRSQVVSLRKTQLQNSIFSQPIQKREIHSEYHGDFDTEELDRNEIVAIYKQLKRIKGSKDTLEDLEEAMRKGEHKGTPIDPNILNLSDDLTDYGEESKDREDLSKIAKPIVQSLSEKEFQLQDEIMKYFNQEIEKEGEDTMNLNVFRVCSVEVDQLADGRVNVSLKEPILKIPSGLADGFRFIKSNEALKQNINHHIIAILIKSGQMAYLEHNKMVNDRWRIIVDVDFYYNRPADAIGFHKDTVGRSLFVNLNFNNDSEIIGPEYVLNPDPIKEHDQHIADKLPQRFLDDLTNERRKLGSPTSIEATRVPSKGMVSFVDELVHHTTPYRDHRGVTGEQLRQYAEHKSGDLFKKVRKAYLFTNFFRGTYKYSTGLTQEKIDDMGLQPDELSHLKGLNKSQVVNTQIFAEMIQFLSDNPRLTKIVRLTRSAGSYKKDELLAHGLTQEEVNELFAGFNKPNMETVSLASCTDKCDVSTESLMFPLPKLRRQMSQDLLTHNVPVPSKTKRQFFRTWVTALPRDEKNKGE